MPPELLPGESVLWEGHPSWRAVVSLIGRGIVIALAVLAVFVLVDVLGGSGWLSVWGVLLGALIVAATIGIAWLTRQFTTYTLTDRRLNVRSGVLSKTEASTSIDRIQNVTVNQTALDRLFGTGTLDFDTASQDRGDRFRMFGIDDPLAVRDRIIATLDARAPNTGVAPGA